MKDELRKLVAEACYFWEPKAQSLDGHLGYEDLVKDFEKLFIKMLPKKKYPASVVGQYFIFDDKTNLETFKEGFQQMQETISNGGYNQAISDSVELLAPPQQQG